MTTKNKKDRPLWSELLEQNLQENLPKGNLLGTLATERYNPPELRGRPSCRTVNMRKFDGSKLYFCTDTRSDKIRDDQSPAYAELCMFFASSRSQFRLSGKLEAVTSEKPVHGVDIMAWWNGLSAAERSWWTWPAPGEERTDESAFHSTLPPPDAPPPHFCVGVLEPDFVDIFDGSSMPFKRSLYKQDGDAKWVHRSVNP